MSCTAIRSAHPIRGKQVKTFMSVGLLASALVLSGCTDGPSGPEIEDALIAQRQSAIFNGQLTHFQAESVSDIERGDVIDRGDMQVYPVRATVEGEKGEKSRVTYAFYKDTFGEWHAERQRWDVVESVQ